MFCCQMDFKCFCYLVWARSLPPSTFDALQAFYALFDRSSFEETHDGGKIAVTSTQDCHGLHGIRLFVNEHLDDGRANALWYVFV